MLFNLVYVVPEVTEYVEGGEIVRETILHSIVQPVEITIDLETRRFTVTTPEPTIDAHIHEEVVGFPVYVNQSFRGLLN